MHIQGKKYDDLYCCVCRVKIKKNAISVDGMNYVCSNECLEEAQ